jgi:serine/threonine-protein kinase
MMDVFERFKQAVAGTYRVERQIGAGGMATVYLARDLKHDRPVAIKIMHAELSAVIGVERFLREIRVAANLSHPHILALHDSGQAEGLLYYVMPYVEGESLRDKLKREQQLSIDEAITIARQVASALHYAHSQGVIHRDIKPENILLHEGVATVADFGAALAVNRAGGSRLTETGLSLGTPEYMSPEQATADRELDARSDVYSLAAVTYEMLVGEPPHTGPNVQAIIAKLLTDAPTRPRTVRGRIPPHVEDAVLDGLAKLPADRVSSAAEFAARLEGRTTVPVSPAPALRSSRRRVSLFMGAAAVLLVAVAVLAWPGLRPGSGVDSEPPRRIAVLYFEDGSAGRELGYLADALTESLIDSLMGDTGLAVISRRGISPFRGSDLMRDSIAVVLGVDAVIEGQVDSTDGRVLVSVWAFNGASGLESELRNAEGTLQEALTLSGQVVGVARGLLRDWTTLQWQQPSERVTAARNAAWLLAQQAERVRKESEELAHERDRAGARMGMLRADSILALAERTDPEWIDPVVQRGRLNLRLTRFARDGGEADRFLIAAVAHSNRALASDSTNAKAYEIRGSSHYMRWLINPLDDSGSADSLLEMARDDLERAIAADPSLASAHVMLGGVHRWTGDRMAAAQAAARSYEEDPYQERANEILRGLYNDFYALEQHSEAARYCEEGYRRFPLDPTFSICQLWLMTTDARPADVDEAWRLANQMIDQAPPQRQGFIRRQAQIVVSGVLVRAGLPDSARSVLAASRVDRATRITRNLLYNEAYIHVLLGDYDEAIDLLVEYVASNPRSARRLEAGEMQFWWWRELAEHPRFGEIGR